VTKVIYFDGASRGNPGPGAAAAVLEEDNEIYLSRKSSQHVTNNVAEFHGLILAIQIATGHGYDDVEFRGDSQLVVNMVNGKFSARDAKMKELLLHARKGLASIPKWSITWIPRDKNSVADRLCNTELNGKT
jgi:ribonuclease HI